MNQILIEAPRPGQVLLVVSDGQRHATVPIDYSSYDQGGWDEPVRKALKWLDGALAVERELARRQSQSSPTA